MSSGESYPAGDPYDARLSRRALLAGMSAAAAALWLSGCSHEQKGPKFADKPDWEQDFSRIPTGAALDPLIWNYRHGDNWGNEQEQTYTDRTQNIRVQDGVLILQANRVRTQDGTPYTSARIDTQGKRNFGYGKLEITARIPRGTGTWPAIWMLADTQRYQPAQAGVANTADNLRILNGEIDIMEAVGSRPGIVYPNLHSLHTTSAHTLDTIPDPNRKLAVPDDATAYHRYGVEHTPKRIIFTLDGKPYYEATKAATVPAGTSAAEAPRYWPFDQNYYLIMNLAMGGDWAGEKRDQYPPYGIDDSTGPWQLRVKSIRHYPFVREES